MLDTLVDVKKEYFKKLMNLTIVHVIQHFSLVFELTSIENAFTYLRDMFDSMVDVEKEYIENFNDVLQGQK